MQDRRQCCRGRARATGEHAAFGFGECAAIPARTQRACIRGGQCECQSDPRRLVSYMWYWTEDKGLTKIDVPNPIFSDLMAMRSAEYALTLGTSQEAQALWLVANYKREVDLPEGQKDATRADNQPSAMPSTSFERITRLMSMP